MTIIDLINQQGGGHVPATTVHQARLRIFQATRRPRMLEQMIETAWGTIRVKGKLGQQHADVLEAIMFGGQRPKDLPDGRIKVLVDAADVRRRARQDGTTFKRVLDDLMQALVEIHRPERLAGIGHLIDHIDFARRADGTYVTVPNPLPSSGGERRLWRVEIGKALCALIDSDLWQRRDPRPIANLRHGISQAVARHVLSHKVGTCDFWSAATLIQAVAGDLSPGAFRDRRRELARDLDALERLGVVIPALRDLKRDVEARAKPRSGEQNRGAREQNRDRASKTAIAQDFSGPSGP